MSKDYTISLKALDGTWEMVGTDRSHGVFAENLAPLVSDRWGNLSGSFDLRRNPGGVFPDIAAGSDCDLEIGGVKVFAGRVKGTPSRDGADRAISVQVEGAQAELDDDVHIPNYVHTSLTDWKDVRSVLTESAVGRDGTAAGLVTVGEGAIVLGWPKGAVMTAAVNAFAGAYLDLGQSGAAKRVTITYKKITGAGGTGNFGMRLRGSDAPNVISNPSVQDVIIDDLGTMSTTDTTVSQTFTTPYRYVSVFLYWASAAGVTLGEDNTMQVSAVRTYAATAYEASDASNLKADDVVRDALSQATKQLSTDWSQIDPLNAVVTNIPSFFSRDNKTPREAWSGVNAYHNFEAKIDEERRPIFRALAATPEVEVGEWTPLEWEDASQGALDDVYNRVIIEATNEYGDPLKVPRFTASLPGASFNPVTTPVVDNPSFTTNTTGWTATAGTITRDTGNFDTSPASGFLGGAGYRVVGTCTGTFRKGITYILQFMAHAGAGATLHVAFGSAGTPADQTVTTGGAGFLGWTKNQVAWTPTADRTDAIITFSYSIAGHGNNANIDSFSILSSQLTTILDRRGLVRTKLLQVDNPLPDDGVAAGVIGDTYLLAHKTTPFKGKIVITGPLREILTGRTIPPEQMLLRVNQLIRLSHLIDPDTGAVGRDGRIVQVTYDWAKDQVTIDLDSTSGNFEALIARLGAISTSH